MSDNTNAQNRAEVKATENLEVVLKLTPAQYNALRMMDKLEDRNKMLQGAIDARIKGSFKAYADKAEAQLAKLYDQSSTRGFKNPLPKDEFLKQYGREVREIVAEL